MSRKWQWRIIGAVLGVAIGGAVMDSGLGGGGTATYVWAGVCTFIGVIAVREVAELVASRRHDESDHRG